MNPKYENRPNRKIFKGFPLEDFLHPKAFSLENVLGSDFLQNSVKSYIKEFSPSKFSNEPKNDSSTTRDLGTFGKVNNPNVIGASDNIKPSFEDILKNFLKGLYFGNFTSRMIKTGPRRVTDLYMYDIGFNTDKTAGFIVRNPFDTLITFSPRDPRYPYTVADKVLARLPKVPNYRVVPVESTSNRKDDPPSRFDKISRINTDKFKAVEEDKFIGENHSSIVCDLNFRIIVDYKNRLQAFSMYGDTIKIHLAKGLVQPVNQSSSGKWVKTGRRLGFNLGSRVITFRKNRLPTWGGAMDLNGTTVLITESNLIGRLNTINLGGTPEKPLILFNKVEILKQP